MSQDAYLFKALGDSTRLKILKMLTDNQKNACQIADQFKLHQPTISYHLKILQESRLVHVKHSGKWKYYSLNPVTLCRALSLLDDLAAGNVMTTFNQTKKDCDRA
ncbi:ArsR/SmtB family transcription factor [Anoxynatronum buryatiense]|uniref:ArsR family transcriptional regulator n=1 Tax=Anoxynatronum buryatiense TaxID=489973 RepID=A0AA45WTD2_9CLOT|nr:metalloregulator ArsR/SmtB family transcription factor [Anoxynatronum buryatiense]SMP41647.1 ArsR family transcriptional regulator [Anoxynatronum buryatiense]